MAIDAIEGEQKLGYMAARQEQLWRLLEMQPTPESRTKAGEIALDIESTSNDPDSKPGASSGWGRLIPKRIIDQIVR
jgi:hypothetical protein